MKEILINSKKYGKCVVFLDEDDYGWLKHGTFTLSNKGYVNIKFQKRLHKLHRLIMSRWENIDDKVIDHIDHNKLNNCKINLRVCSQSENAKNQKGNNNKKYKGVYKKSENRYFSSITSNGKQYHIGYFDDELTAAKAYDQMARILHGEFAYLNFPDEEEYIVIPDKIINKKNYKSSKYIGVSLHQSGKWHASIQVDGIQINIGYFITEFDGAIARDKYILENNIGNKYDLNFDKDIVLNYEIPKKNKKYIGIYKRNNNRWEAAIYLKEKYVYIGSFCVEIDAVVARNNYIIENNLQSSRIKLNVL